MNEETGVSTNTTGGGRSLFSGKMGFVLSAAASAIGLGNLWRFPYLAAKYGGGAFLIVYLLLVATFGFALMMAEVGLGRKTRLSTIGAYKSIRKKWAFVGVLASAVPFLITPYYAVIGGWVTKYTVSYFTTPADQIAQSGYFTSFITEVSPETFVYTFIFLAICIAVVAFGVKSGVEKSSKILMPVLIGMSVVITVVGCMQPGAAEGIAYFLIPDFSKISVEMVVAAMGQMFFSLSLAMGIMVTYGSYLRKEDNLEKSVRNIEVFDSLIAILAGFMIIPACFAVTGSGAGVAENAGPSLMFVVLPQIFSQFGPAANFMGAAFFLLVLFAAATSSISLLEACISIVSDGLKCSRGKSIVICSIFMFVVATVVNMGYNVWIGVDPEFVLFGIGQQGDHQILDFLDFLSNTIMMPIVALLTCIFVGWIIKPKAVIEEVEQEGVTMKAKKLFTVMIKYIAPVFTVAILIGYVLMAVGAINL